MDTLVIKTQRFKFVERNAEEKIDDLNSSLG